VSADTAAAAHSPQARHADSLGTIILRISAYLALIVLVIVLFVWLMRKTGMVGSSRIGGGTMDMLEALPIGQGRTIALVRVLDTVLVLAQSGQQITLLDKIEGQKALEVIASTKGGTSIVQFKEVFNSFFGKMKKSSS
jgi:flagellar biosynthetic protein FliO